MALPLRSLAPFLNGGMGTGEMAKAPFKRSWRGFYDRLLKDEKYQKTFDTDRYGPYRSYRKIFIQIDRVLKRYPRQITPISIGTSVGGEPIWVFQVNNATDSSKKPVSFLVTSLIHSIEYIGADHGDEKPFFAYLSLQAQHYPLQAPQKYIGTSSASWKHFTTAGRSAWCLPP